ncbi:hypothetical protein KSP39_PZI005484 [Platanthera zijinensis]|uniref:Uncharacterized protein n=1 Tax=Platanthera zijinensis TaxID=2320716 RepID=A0AAP0BRD5_9ASPA
MNSYSKIRHASIDLPSDAPPIVSSFEAKQRGFHGATTLRRSRSSAAQRFDDGEQSHAIGLQSALRRAFSTRRASLIDHGYWRMQDRGDRFLAEEEDDGGEHRLRDTITMSNPAEFGYIKPY